MQYNTTRYNTNQYNTIQYNTIQYKTPLPWEMTQVGGQLVDSRWPLGLQTAAGQHSWRRWHSHVTSHLLEPRTGPTWYWQIVSLSKLLPQNRSLSKWLLADSQVYPNYCWQIVSLSKLLLQNRSLSKLLLADCQSIQIIAGRWSVYPNYCWQIVSLSKSLLADGQSIQIIASE